MMNQQDTSYQKEVLNETSIDRNKIVWRIINNEAIILNLDSGHYYALNKTASFIWKMLSEEKDSEEIILKMMQRYRISRETAEQDVRLTIKSLEQENILFCKR